MAANRPRWGHERLRAIRTLLYSQVHESLCCILAQLVDLHVFVLRVLLQSLKTRLMHDCFELPHVQRVRLVLRWGTSRGTTREVRYFSATWLHSVGVSLLPCLQALVIDNRYGVGLVGDHVLHLVELVVLVCGVEQGLLGEHGRSVRVSFLLWFWGQMVGWLVFSPFWGLRRAGRAWWWAWRLRVLRHFNFNYCNKPTSTTK